MESLKDIMKHFTPSKDQRDLLKKSTEEILSYPKVQTFLKENKKDIDQEMIEKSLPKLNEFVQEDKKLEKGEEGANPGFAPYLFINYGYIDVAYRATEDYYKYQDKQKKSMLMNNHMMSRDVRKAELTNYDVDTNIRQALMNEIITFLKEYRQDKFNAKGLYIYGSFGVGKTYLMGALANELVERNESSVFLCHYPTFLNELKETFSDNSTQQHINETKQVDVLIIDDIGAESNTPWGRDDVLNPILEYRMKESLPTFFTSNFNLDELLIHLTHSKGMNEELKARRVMERIKYLAKPFYFTGEDRRQKAAE